MAKTLETWCGSRVSLDRWPKVLAGWRSYAKRLERQLQRAHNPKLKPQSLEYQLTEILSRHCGERAETHRHGGEGAVDTLCRIIHERDRAMEILALDRIRERSPF